MTTVLAGKITTDDTTANVVLLHNPAGAVIESVEKVPNVDGQFIVTIDKEILNSETPPKWYTGNSQSEHYVIAPINAKQFAIQQYEADGTEKDSVCQGAEFQIVNY